MQSPFLLDREVIPPDERTPVADPLAVPFRWICSLDITYPDGEFARGSGVLIGPRQVLTAAHNIYREKDGTSPSSVHVAPARNGREDPLGRHLAVAFSVTSRFLQTQRIGGRTVWPWRGGRFDFALVTLADDLSTTRLGNGQLGHWGHRALGHATELRALDQAYLTGKHVTVCGYPGDWCGRTPIEPARGCDPRADCSKRDRASLQLVHHGTVSFAPGLTGVLLHTADTRCGQSGSPVWIRFTDGRRVLVGVHVDAHRVRDATTGALRPIAANRAVHLTADVIQLVRTWMP